MLVINVNLLNNYEQLLAPVHSFLACRTPAAWIEQAAQPEMLAVLLTDHLHCELKAAQSAGLLLRRYALDAEAGEQLLAWLEPYETQVYRGHLQPQVTVTPAQKNQAVPRLRLREGEPWQHELVDKMVLLMKEELHHFEQVLAMMDQYGVSIQPITAARYAGGLLRNIRGSVKGGLVDKLIIGAIIEARSCERFAALVPYLPEDIARFYVSLLRSEARHFEDYLALAAMVQEGCIQQRVEHFLGIEQRLIESPDTELRFHSGPVM